MKTRVLVVDDEPDASELLKVGLQKRGYDAYSCTDGQAALAALEEQPFDVVVTDLKMAGQSGLDLCSRISDQHPEIPVILMTAHGSLEVAVESIRAGVFDFLTKPVDFQHLAHCVQRAVRHRELEYEVKRLRRVIHERPTASNMVGSSNAITKVTGMIDRVGESDVNVLVTGESGVGKELVARALHTRGPTSEGPFVAINCAAVPANLLESELFGHVRGAFTDAKRSRDGLFVQASGGTLFLDEIGDLPMEMQPKLLRAIQERRVRPVGGEREIAFDARIVSATNRDLEEDVEEGRFREDLFYRINVVRIHVPPLRARGTDVLLLAQHFLEKIAARTDKPVKGLSVAAGEKLLAYDWPGNVRELENAMERAIALAQYEELLVGDLPEKVRRYEAGEMVVAGNDPSELPTLEELENRYIRRVLKSVRGNKTQAAEVLGLARRTLYRRLERIEDIEDGPSGP